MKKQVIMVLIPAAVMAITLAVFSGVLHADFVMWDDDIIILNNPNLRTIDVGWAFTDMDSMMRYNPLTFLSWALTYHFAGFDPFWFHAGNWMLHGLSAVLLFFILIDLLSLAADRHGWVRLSPLASGCAAAAGSLVWAIHPLRVEPVAWATDRTYCQAMFFLLGSLLLYLKAHQATERRKKRTYLALSATCYVLSLLSYALGLTFFIVFLVLDLFLLKRIDRAAAEGRWSVLWPVIEEKLLFVVPAIAFSILSLVARSSPHAGWALPPSLSQFGVFERMMQAFYIWAYYLWKTLYPVHLAPIYMTLVSFDPTGPAFLASAGAVIGLSLFLIIDGKQRPFLLGIWISYLVLMVPFLGLFEYPHFPVDRYSLLPALCLSVLAAFLIARFLPVLGPLKTFAVPASALVLLGWLSFHQAAVWQDSETLFTQIIRTLGDDPYRQRFYNRLGVYFANIGNREKAITYFSSSLMIDQTSSFAAFARQRLDLLKSETDAHFQGEQGKL